MIALGRRTRGGRAAAAVLAAALVVPSPLRADEAAPVAAPEATPSPAAPEPPPPAEPAGTTKDRRTLRAFPRNLAAGAVRVGEARSLGILAAGAVLAGAASLADEEVIEYFERHPHERFGDVGEEIGGWLVVSSLTTAFFSAGRLAGGARFRAGTYDLGQAVLVNGAVTHLVKFAARRKRPAGSTSRLSFPSGHTSNAFAVATVVARHYGAWGGVPAYAVATAVGASRLAGADHHLSDVVAGAVLGFVTGRAVVKANSRPLGPRPPAVTVEPDAGPQGAGLGLRLRVAF